MYFSSNDPEKFHQTVRHTGAAARAMCANHNEEAELRPDNDDNRTRMAGTDDRWHQEDGIPPDQAVLDETIREGFGAVRIEPAQRAESSSCGAQEFDPCSISRQRWQLSLLPFYLVKLGRRPKNSSQSEFSCAILTSMSRFCQNAARWLWSVSEFISDSMGDGLQLLRLQRSCARLFSDARWDSDSA